MTFDGYASASASNLNSASIANLAAQVTSTTGYSPGGDLDAVVEMLGGKIQFVDLYGVSGESESGSVLIDGFRDFTITLANHTGPLRDRFTVAHEVGHYVLHYLYPSQIQGKPLGKVRAQRYRGGRVETEANMFAACFLMPESEYREFYSKSSGSHTAISETFGVSTYASRLRARNLGLE